VIGPAVRAAISQRAHRAKFRSVIATSTRMRKPRDLDFEEGRAAHEIKRLRATDWR